MIGGGLIQKVGEVSHHLFFFLWFSLPYYYYYYKKTWLTDKEEMTALLLFHGSQMEVFSGRRSYPATTSPSFKIYILSPSPFPFPLRVQINNPGLVQRIVITQKKKTCRPIPSISLSMHPMMHELVRSLRGLIHHCRMQDKNVSDHLFFSTLFFSTPTLSPPQSNPRARLQKYWLFRQLHCR